MHYENIYKYYLKIVSKWEKQNNKIYDSKIYQINKSIDVFNCLAFQLNCLVFKFN